MTTILTFIQNLFNINTTFFTLLDYPMSYIEFIGTIFTVWCVWLTARAKLLSWPVGIVGTVLYIFLFYQIRLYSDLIEQVYFLITGFIGWWIWLHPKNNSEKNSNGELLISRNSSKENYLYILTVGCGTFVLAYITLNLDNWFPSYFPEQTTFPFVDAFTTSMSFVAQWLLAKKRLESWILWIIVDIIGIWLYWSKGVKFISIEYIIFLGIAIKGYIDWGKKYKSYSSANEHI